VLLWSSESPILTQLKIYEYNIIRANNSNINNK
jgi:hypothetical protein